MAITKERFEQGMSYQAYKEQMTRNQERFANNERQVEISGEDVAFFANLKKPLYLMALAEDWCGDVINNLPVVGKLVETSPNLHLSIFLRDQNLDLMDQYLKEGQFRSIPVFAFFDENFKDLGHFIERPASISAKMAAMRHDLFTNDPILSKFAPGTPPGDMPEEARNQMAQAFARFRDETRNFSDHEVVRELRSLVEHGSVQPAKASAPVVLQTAASNGSAPTTSERAKVTITYCAECGYEPQTLELAGALMREFVSELSSIEILPWHDGAFDVHVNGDLVHSMYRDGGFPENETIIQAVRERIG